MLELNNTQQTPWRVPVDSRQGVVLQLVGSAGSKNSLNLSIQHIMKCHTGPWVTESWWELHNKELQLSTSHWILLCSWNYRTKTGHGHGRDERRTLAFGWNHQGRETTWRHRRENTIKTVAAEKGARVWAGHFWLRTGARGWFLRTQ
jgi:hypothetical protein